MNAEAARALFERALEGGLDVGTQREFEAALRADDELHDEFIELQVVRRAGRDVGRAATGDNQAPNVDLLTGVQQKLRARSGGKFYRDRFSERRGLGFTWMLALASLVLLAATGWLVMHYLAP
jgi:hypothetical protein